MLRGGENLAVNIFWTIRAKTKKNMIGFNDRMIMKIGASIFFLAAVIGMPYANTSLGGEIKSVNPLISLKVDNEPLGSVLKRISKISGYAFSLQGELTDRQVSVVLDNIPLEAALNRILRDLNHAIIWSQEEKKIIVVIIDERSSPGNREIRDTKSSPIEIFRRTQRDMPGKKLHSITRHTSDTRQKRKPSRAGPRPSISGRDTDFVQGSRTRMD